jgi:hypothetical protein
VSRRRIEAPFGSDGLDERLTVVRQTDLAKRQELVNPEQQLAALVRAGERRSLPDRRLRVGRPPAGAEERRSGVERRVEADDVVEKAGPLQRVLRPRKDRADADKRAAVQAQIDRVRGLTAEDGPPAA